jgi:NAD(P)-dependent dehydrogenase (short-subunit alcohol dehydrogenase family)
MQDLYSGRSAIVTGGARGIGLAIAQTLGLLGARVLIVDNGAALDGGPEDPAVTELAAMRVPGSIGLAIDIGAEGAAQQAVDTALREFGAVDLLVNNAAIECDAPIGEGRREDFERMLRTNLVAPFALAAAAVPVLRAQVKAGRRPGAIVNMVSSVGPFGRPGRSGEAASKAGLLGLTRSLAQELAADRIGCNAIAPFAGTRAVRAMPDGDGPLAGFRDRTMGLAASDVAQLVAFLGAPQAAGISGQLFGARGREVFVWTAARPAASSFQPRAFDADEYAATIGGLRRDFVDLADDIAAFGDDPVA